MTAHYVRYRTIKLKFGPTIGSRNRPLTVTTETDRMLYLFIVLDNSEKKRTDLPSALKVSLHVSPYFTILEQPFGSAAETEHRGESGERAVSPANLRDNASSTNRRKRNHK